MPPKIINLSKSTPDRPYTMKRGQVMRALENGSCAWVVVNVSVRDLNLTEAIAARIALSALREPLPFAEIPGIIFKHSGAQNELRTVATANKWALENTK